MDIGTKLQMYTIVAPYNIRSVGSLAAETTVGILQSLYPNNQVSIKARDVPGIDVKCCGSHDLQIESK